MAVTNGDNSAIMASQIAKIEIRTMARVGMERADLVVAVTGDDEDNLVICQVAKRWFGVPTAIGAVTPNSTYPGLFR